MPTGTVRTYESDDMDGIELNVSVGGNGDYYLAIAPKGRLLLVPCVRICTSGGAAAKRTRLMLAVAELYRAMEDE